jgi:tetratricopeptide (TPR) repeat protein
MALNASVLEGSEYANALFPNGSAQAAYMEQSASRALSDGLDLFSKGEYDQAIVALRRSVGLAMASYTDSTSASASTAINAYDYLAKAYLQKGDNDRAISAYKLSINVDRSNAATYVSLGNIYYGQDDFEEATRQYALAVKYDPSAANRYSLGQGYMAQGQYDEAQRQFQMVRDMTPNEASAYDALGQLYARQGRTEEAVSSFDRALALQDNFWQALVNKGYALADAGQIDAAEVVLQTLTENSSDYADTLETYIYEKSAPELTYKYATSTFSSSLGAGTAVSSLGLYLSNAGDAQTFSMLFQFSKQMDPVSVQNVTNWTLTRATGAGAFGYNFSQPAPATEVTLPYYPAGVSYDQETMIATVFFKVTQNSTADGTLDPSHIQFTFKGVDVLGLAMNPDADQYTGFSGFA